MLNIKYIVKKEHYLSIFTLSVRMKERDGQKDRQKERWKTKRMVFISQCYLENM